MTLLPQSETAIRRLMEALEKAETEAMRVASDDSMPNPTRAKAKETARNIAQEIRTFTAVLMFGD
jgi:small-conductance mechanosensitive channel